MQRILTRAIWLITLIGLSACGGGELRESSGIRNGIGHNQDGRDGGESVSTTTFRGVKIGRPYQIMGQTYTPRYDPYYDQVGIASWYGPGFHGNATANGERYDQYAMTAAHTTLPMPSFVRVTNLENKKTCMVKINDRGPFHDGRIIDLSQAAAKKLGVIARGTARVRVQYLSEETERYIASNGADYPSGLGGTTLASATSIRPRQTFETADSGTAAPVISVRESVLPPASGEPPAILPATAQAVAEAQKDAKPTTLPFSVGESDYIKNAKQETMVVAMVDTKPGQYTPPKDSPFARQQSPFQTASSGKPKAVGAPAPATSAKPSGNWAVQVASFAQPGNAEQMMSKLATVGSPNLREVDVNGKRWYRVLVWPNRPGISEQELLDAVTGLGIQDAKIIRNMK